MYVNKLEINPQREINEKFLSACLNGDLKQVDYLLNVEKADIHYKDDDGFTYACVNGHLHIVKYLLNSPTLKDKINHKSYNDLGLVMACENNHINVVRYLLESKELEVHADLHTYNSYAFLHAAKKGYLELLDYLISFDTCNQEQVEAFFVEACKNKQYHIVQYFIFNLNFNFNEDVEIYIRDDMEGLNFIKQQITKRELYNKLQDLDINVNEDSIQKV